MQPLHVQEYLKTHTFGQLEAEFGVGVSVSKSRPYKFSVNYDQIESKAGPLVNQCRGLVLRVEPSTALPTDSKALREVCPGETVVLARPFDRFFNQGDVNCAPVDWNDPELSVLEKLDGTLAIVYFDDIADSWCMATRSVPDADLPYTSWGRTLTFRELFDEALFNTTGMPNGDHPGVPGLVQLMRNSWKAITHLFELTSPLNRIVVKYPEARLTWLASRNRETGVELTHYEATHALWDYGHDHFPPEVKKFPVSTLHELHDLLELSDPMALEGAIVMDSKRNRIKVKSVAWLAANRVKTSCGSERSVMSLILDEKIDDAMEFLDDTGKRRVEEIKKGITAMIKTYDRLHNSWMETSQTQKEFALLVTGAGFWSSPFFEMRAKKITMKEWIYSKRDKATGWPDNFIDRLTDYLPQVIELPVRRDANSHVLY